MKKTVVGLFFTMVSLVANAQTVYDSKTLVDTNNTSTSTSTVNTNNTSTSTSTSTNTSTVNSNSTNTNTNTNTNYNVNSGTQTINNNNVNSGTMTYNNNNVNSGTMTYNNNNVNNSTSTNTNTNTNYNVNSGTQTFNNNNTSTSNNVNTNNNVNSGDQTIRSVQSGGTNNTNTNTNTNISTSENTNRNIQSGDMTNRNINDTTMRVVQPPPTAIAPAMMSGGNNDLCTTGTSGSVQTQIFGVSSGGTVRDLNCERLKNAKTLFDMGMKVAAVATLCQDRRVFDAMWNAGTPCPYEGKIGETAKIAWTENQEKIPKLDEPNKDDSFKKIGIGSLLGIAVFKLFGL